MRQRGRTEFLLLFLLFPFLSLSQQVKKDSILRSQADSVTQKVTSTSVKADSLSEAQLARMENAVNHLTHRMDSAKSKGISTQQYQHQLDSIQRKLSSHLSLKTPDQAEEGNQKIQRKFKAAQDSVSRKVNHRAEALRQKIRARSSALDSAGLPVKDPTGQVHLPQKDIPGLPGTSLPSSPTVPNTGMNVPAAQIGLPAGPISLPTKEITEATKEVKQIENTVSKEAGTVSKEAGAIGKEAGELKTAGTKVTEAKKELKEAVNDREKIKEAETNAAKELEQRAGGMKEVKELKELKQPNPLEQYKTMLEDFKKGVDPKQWKEVSQKQLTNPFVGQEAKLQSGMEELEKLKKKYGEINEHTFPLKRIHNSLKGKPFRERFIPGLSFQVLTGAGTGLDVIPYAMYRLSGRIRLGVGFNYRLQSNGHYMIEDAHVPGVRAMADVRLHKAWYFHVEGEWLHFDPARSISHFPSDPMTKEWSDRLNVGILRNYKVSRRLNGMFELLYFAGDWRAFPQAKNTSIRFGLEYKLGMGHKRPASSKNP